MRRSVERDHRRSNRSVCPEVKGYAWWVTVPIVAPMNEVYLLGSGFSKAIDSRMPTLSELSANVYAAMAHAWDDAWGQDLRDNVELLLTYLGTQAPWARAPERHYALGKYHDVLDVVVHMLREAQSSVLGDENALPAWLADLTRLWHQQRATVITFNYDVLVEQAFSQTVHVEDGQQRSHAHPSMLYPVPVTPATARAGGAWAPDDFETFSLLKLHGSLTWYYSGTEAPPGDNVYSLVDVGWQPPSTDRDHWVVDKEPLVVPPLLEKSAFYANDVLRKQWEMAREAIKSADHVTCIGYSLPPTDLTVRFLLSTAVPDLSISIVDLHAQRTARHYRRLLPGFHVVEHADGPNSIADFVASLGRATENHDHSELELEG